MQIHIGGKKFIATWKFINEVKISSKERVMVRKMDTVLKRPT